MAFKDYYAVLGIKPSATQADIKKSYRRLAMKYHPDKNQGDALATAVFIDIAEAYETLSNPEARKRYDYKHTEVFNARLDKKQAVTEYDVIKQISTLQKNVAASNLFGINQDALFFQLSQILTPYNLSLLNEASAEERQHAIGKLLRCCAPLSYPYAKKLSDTLLAIAANDEAAQLAVAQFLQQSLLGSRWHKYKTLAAVILAVILCLVMFLLSRTPSAP